MTAHRISRRTLLRGLGAAVALPWLEAMGPPAGAAPASQASNRLAFLYVPNGKNMPDWTPKAEGPGFELTPILESLRPVRDDVLVLTGLTADKARPHGDGPGDHARAMAAYLTGCQPRKTDGTDIRAGISADQVAAARLGDRTRLPSLELGCERGAVAGNCDSGYSCVYSSSLAWRSATQPLPRLVDPRQVFDRLFGAALDPDRAARDRRRHSILDFVRDDASDLQSRLGAGDRRKLDEYFAAVRDVERRIERADKLPPAPAPGGGARPAGVPAGYDEHLRLMCDLVVLAFQADVTRVCTFVFANEGSNRPYSFAGVREGHHDLSHHGNDVRKRSKIREINRFHVGVLARLLTRLKAIPEGDGTLLDHCMVAYGSGNSDGNAHNHDDLPVLLAGRGCGSIRPGRHLRYPKETPLNNLWLALLERVGCQVPALGDGTGPLPGLSG
jgi:hypothetical protein